MPRWSAVRLANSPGAAERSVNNLRCPGLPLSDSIAVLPVDTLRATPVCSRAPELLGGEESVISPAQGLIASIRALSLLRVQLSRVS